MHRIGFACLALMIGLIPNLVQAEIKLPKVFGEHMVLQREKPIKIWGTATPQSKVRVTLGDDQAVATAEADGRWLVTLPSRKAGGPFELTISEGDQDPAIHYRDILIGEVWLCSGQSML